MVKIRITMNGSEVLAPQGVTILDAAKSVGINIPTLCHHPKLEPIGACRICVVEVKGQRSLVTSCTFPVFEGMEVETESPKVVAARKLILDMLFSERNHYCPFCEMSGDCELQNLGYLYGIDHWVFPTYTRAFPVDSTRTYFFMDQNRCVLCQRCVRPVMNLLPTTPSGSVSADPWRWSAQTPTCLFPSPPVFPVATACSFAPREPLPTGAALLWDAAIRRSVLRASATGAASVAGHRS